MSGRGGGPPPARKSLSRVLSRAGLCSRTEAAKLVTEGRVTVDGRPARDPELRIDERLQTVDVDGRRLTRAEPLVIALHKPVDCVTTLRDAGGRRTVYDLLTGLTAWVSPVGRLDRDTSGLLLLTNDIQLADALTAPARHVPRLYRVTASGRLDAADLDRLRQGLTLDDGPTRPAEVRLIDIGPRNTQFEIALTEGRNRQVRRMVAAVGGRVAKLRRVAFGPLRLDALDLAPGAWRALIPGEVAGLRAAVAVRTSGRGS